MPTGCIKIRFHFVFLVFIFTNKIKSNKTEVQYCLNHKRFFFQMERKVRIQSCKKLEHRAPFPGCCKAHPLIFLP